MNQEASSEFAVRVDGLSYNVNAEHLREIFGTYGKIRKTAIAKDKVGHSAGWGVIGFETADMATIAIDTMNNGWIDGIQITVRAYDPSTDHISESNSFSHTPM